MSGATQRAGYVPSTRPEGAIIQPGRNCWRLDRADRFYCIQDAAHYFQLVRRALLEARDTVFILGWDIASTIDLAPGLSGADAPTRLDALIAFIAKRRPHLRIYILIWDYGSLYTLEREPLTRWRLRWRMPRRVRFGFDDHHPVGASHHQKIVVVDDQLAFCGGIDLTGHRWDTSDHRLEEPARKTIMGLTYDPYHEVQAMVSGPAAASLGVLSRDRWRSIGYDHLPPIGTASDDLWPSDIAPDLTGVDVAISRTMPASDGQPAIRECEALFHDSIARAKRLIYIENQYFTDDTLAGALAARLTEPDGPEVVIVVPKECHGWLERQSMGAFRDVAFRRLTDADSSGRLRLVYPIASRAHDVPTFVHSKVMIVDDELVRIGSANFARRSMGMDSECDLAVEAGGDAQVRAGIRRIRDRLVAEHLGLAVDAVSAGDRTHRIAVRADRCASRRRSHATPSRTGDRSGRRTVDGPSSHHRSRRATWLWPGADANGAASRRDRRQHSAASVDPARDRAPRRAGDIRRDQHATGIPGGPGSAARHSESAVSALDRHDGVCDGGAVARPAGIADHCRRRSVRRACAADSWRPSARWRWR